MKPIIDFFRSGPEKRAAADLYDSVVAAARRPALYETGGVADTVDGRFDMIALHAFLLFRRMSGAPGWQAVGDELANHIMKDMDRSLREMGVGDMSVGKKMKKLAQAFYGRLDAYWGALKADRPDALEEVLVRNVYRDPDMDEARRARAAACLATYCRAQMDHLANEPTAAILAGRVGFADADAVLPGAGAGTVPDKPDRKEAAE
ncbi:ubiquinol-cytochrome C chaperone [Marivibrio halodurans]|uniref:Ubiquinol-cytochrome C chaperone n=1 Tax=Marivibrio halodurans TaxID=2039722 RepID=A0A8J7S556_9PROT|nr:ubiquinol-cytochrome C chaperone [Marivibrio halodurans]